MNEKEIQNRIFAYKDIKYDGKEHKIAKAVANRLVEGYLTECLPPSKDGDFVVDLLRGLFSVLQRRLVDQYGEKFFYCSLQAIRYLIANGRAFLAEIASMPEVFSEFKTGGFGAEDALTVVFEPFVVTYKIDGETKRFRFNDFVWPISPADLRVFSKIWSQILSHLVTLIKADDNSFMIEDNLKIKEVRPFSLEDISKDPLPPILKFDWEKDKDILPALSILHYKRALAGNVLLKKIDSRCKKSIYGLNFKNQLIPTDSESFEKSSLNLCFGFSEEAAADIFSQL